jgi:cysteine-rich repeat protein
MKCSTRPPASPWFTIALVVAVSAALATRAGAQTIEPPFDTAYTYDDLGTPPMLPAPAGGLTFSPGDPNVLLIGGAADSFSADIFSIGVTRDAGGHIIGFSGNATFYADAYGFSGGLDGGLSFGPDGVLFYTTYGDHHLGQIKPGSTAPDKLISLATEGLAGSTGTLAFVPPGFPGAGRFKIVQWDTPGNWYDVTLAPDGSGTFNVTGATLITAIGGGPEGIIYIAAGSTEFAAHSVLVSEFIANRVSAYEIDANGDPLPATRRDFMTLSGAEGAVLDPLTGDFLFSTFGGGNRVIVVRGNLCGNGVLDPGEACDDGNTSGGDGCEITCTPTGCGDAVVAGAEECDDGNIVSGDCCSSGCLFETVGSSCPDDGNACTIDPHCDGAGACVHDFAPSGAECADDELCTIDECDGAGTCLHLAVPDTSCRAPTESGRGLVKLRTNRIFWKWVRGEATALGAFGTPARDTDYAVCVFDASGAPQPLMAARAPAGGTCTFGNPCWAPKGPNRIDYNDQLLGSPDGITQIRLKSGIEGKASVLVRGLHPSLGFPAPPLVPPVTVQLHADNGECWGAVYSTPRVNDTTQFKANPD